MCGVTAVIMTTRSAIPMTVTTTPLSPLGHGVASFGLVLSSHIGPYGT